LELSRNKVVVRERAAGEYEKKTKMLLVFKKKYINKTIIIFIKK